MGLRELAQKDAAHTIEGKQAGNTVFTLSDKARHSWEITGFVGVIGYSVDTEGNRVAGRAVCASFLASRVKINGKTVTPAPGWKLVYRNLDGEMQESNVVFAEPDRTIGLVRVYLSLDMSGTEQAVNND